MNDMVSGKQLRPTIMDKLLLSMTWSRVIVVISFGIMLGMSLFGLTEDRDGNNYLGIIFLFVGVPLVLLVLGVMTILISFAKSNTKYKGALTIIGTVICVPVALYFLIALFSLVYESLPISMKYF